MAAPLSHRVAERVPDAAVGYPLTCQDLEKVAVTGDGLRAALTQGGVPCTVEELKQRFDRYVAGLTKGKNAKKVRVVVE